MAYILRGGNSYARSPAEKDCGEFDSRDIDVVKRSLELDGVRGIAIILVLLWHYCVRQVVVEHGSVPHFLVSALSLSWSGVDLFFVLSGFLITGILLDHRDASNFFGVFYLRRACRILPLYFVVLLLFIYLPKVGPFASAPFDWLFKDPYPLWSYATFTQNILMGLKGQFGPNWINMTWSLAVEEQFYLLVPLLVYFLPRRPLLVVFVLAILAAPLLRAATPGLIAYINAPWRADSLLSGAALAVLVRQPLFIAAVHQHRSMVVRSLWVFLLGAAVMTTQEDWCVIWGAFNHFWLSLFYSVLILVAYAGIENRVTGFLRSPVLVWFGQLSYGIYMFHQPVSGLLHGFLSGGPPLIRSLGDAGITLLALMVTLLCAAISFHLLEKPILRWGRRSRYLMQTGFDSASKVGERPARAPAGANPG